MLGSQLVRRGEAVGVLAARPQLEPQGLGGELVEGAEPVGSRRRAVQAGHLDVHRDVVVEARRRPGGGGTAVTIRRALSASSPVAESRSAIWERARPASGRRTSPMSLPDRGHLHRR